jgi:hypothetical protein
MTAVSINTVSDSKSSSDSIVCEGSLQKYKTRLPVIVKITYPRKSEKIEQKGYYNSGLSEQALYSYFATKAGLFTPHVAKLFLSDEKLELKTDCTSQRQIQIQKQRIMDQNTDSNNVCHVDMKDPVVIVTEKLEGQTLNKWMGNLLENRDELAKFCYDVLFQIAYTLLVFGDLGVMHNDLHTANVFAAEIPSTKLSYEIRPGFTVEKEVKYYVKIYI